MLNNKPIKKPKHAGGRPRKYTPEQMNNFVKKFENYIEETQIPIIAEFAYLNNITRPELYDFPEFSTLLKKCIAKKETMLEKLALLNKINPSMAIFSLKQCGWSDKRELTVNTDDETKEKLKQYFDDKYKSNS